MSNPKTKHTPGQLQMLSADMAGTQGIQIRDTHGSAIAVMTGPWTLEQEIQFARLFVAAPDLLAALELIANTRDGFEAADIARQTIAKATGGTK